MTRSVASLIFAIALMLAWFPHARSIAMPMPDCGGAMASPTASLDCEDIGEAKACLAWCGSAWANLVELPRIAQQTLPRSWMWLHQRASGIPPTPPLAPPRS